MVEGRVARADRLHGTWVTLLGARGGSVGYQGGSKHENPISEAATGSPPAVSGACVARALPSHTATVAESLYPF